MRHLPTIAGVLLGLLFLAASIPYFLHMVPEMKFEEGSPMQHFFGAFGPTHYMDVVKALELIGGLLVLIPKTRRLGLLVLGPIMVNIVLFNLLVAPPEALKQGLPMVAIMVVLGLYLVFAERRAFAAYLRGG